MNQTEGDCEYYRDSCDRDERFKRSSELHSISPLKQLMIILEKSDRPNQHGNYQSTIETGINRKRQYVPISVDGQVFERGDR
jgi:hypothetical protein